jgi:rhodanese-related sulfurtransferase
MKIAAIIAVVVVLVLMYFLRPKPDIASAEARKLVAEGAQLVDVRSPSEFASDHIDGARNIPVDMLGTRLGELAKDKPVVLYCASGARSTRAAALLRAEGFEAVHNLGAMSAW